jgi:hypothetical protein
MSNSVAFGLKQAKRAILGHSLVVFGLKRMTRLTKRVMFKLIINGLTGQAGRLEPNPPTWIANPHRHHDIYNNIIGGFFKVKS